MVISNRAMTLRGNGQIEDVSFGDGSGSGLVAYRSSLAEVLTPDQPLTLKLFFDLKSQNADSPSAALVDLDDHTVQLWILACRLVTNRQASQESRDHQLRLYPNNAVVRSGHS